MRGDLGVQFVLGSLSTGLSPGGLSFHGGTSEDLYNRIRWDGRFDPSRFARARESSLQRYQYLPFGAGPRICIGMAFAMLEAKAVLATFVRAMRFSPVEGCDPEPMSRLTLRPAGGMRLRASVR